VHGDRHALIHPDIPAVPNVGYLVDGAFYHPGNAFFVPGATVETLLLPTSGPWMKLGEAADYVRAVRPQRVVQIHEMLLSEIGLNLAGTILGREGLTGIPDGLAVYWLASRRPGLRFPMGRSRPLRSAGRGW
jgi:hypothetical protein